jgi:fumarate hydratase subunit beta
MIRISVPQELEKLKALKAGDEVRLSGIIYTARDQAHKRICEAIRGKKKLPFDLNAAAIYYCGPAGTPRGSVIGSCGPTTSRRMDAFTPLLLSRGVRAMIGKGSRSAEVVSAIKKSKAVYLLAPAGCGALCAQFVRAKRLRAFPDLGPEAVYELEFSDFPLVVGIDSKGASLF